MVPSRNGATAAGILTDDTFYRDEVYQSELTSAKTLSALEHRLARKPAKSCVSSKSGDTSRTTIILGSRGVLDRGCLSLIRYFVTSCSACFVLVCIRLIDANY